MEKQHTFVLLTENSGEFQYSFSILYLDKAFIKTETHIILSEKPAFFEDANRDCILRNGFLSKFC